MSRVLAQYSAIVGLGYLFISLIGYVYEYRLLSEYNINIFHFSETTDFLEADLKQFAFLLFAGGILIVFFTGVYWISKMIVSFIGFVLRISRFLFNCLFVVLQEHLLPMLSPTLRKIIHPLGQNISRNLLHNRIGRIMNIWSHSTRIRDLINRFLNKELQRFRIAFSSDKIRKRTSLGFQISIALLFICTSVFITVQFAAIDSGRIKYMITEIKKSKEVTQRDTVVARTNFVKEGGVARSQQNIEAARPRYRLPNETLLEYIHYIIVRFCGDSRNYGGRVDHVETRKSVESGIIDKSVRFMDSLGCLFQVTWRNIPVREYPIYSATLRTHRGVVIENVLVFLSTNNRFVFLHDLSDDETRVIPAANIADLYTNEIDLGEIKKSGFNPIVFPKKPEKHDEIERVRGELLRTIWKTRSDLSEEIWRNDHFRWKMSELSDSIVDLDSDFASIADALDQFDLSQTTGGLNGKRNFDLDDEFEEALRMAAHNGARSGVQSEIGDGFQINFAERLAGAIKVMMNRRDWETFPYLTVAQSLVFAECERTKVFANARTKVFANGLEKAVKFPGVFGLENSRCFRPENP